MDFNQRKKVIENLTYVEQKFPVETWKLEGIHIWPILKMKLFFMVFHIEKEKRAETFFLKMGRYWQLFKKLSGSVIEIIKLENRKVDFVFSGSHTHRIWHKGGFINRYFDPLIDYLKKNDRKCLGLEYNSLDKVSIPYIKIDLFIYFFKVRSINTDPLFLDKGFQTFLGEASTLFSVEKLNILVLLRRNVENIISWKRLYLYLFRKIQPKYSFGLCYYDNAMYGMNAAAKELDIISVDMQHGAQGNLHAAYSFRKLPEEGYNVLPKEFWCWDMESYEQLLTWSKGSFHQIRLTGNPWFEFLLSNSSELKDDLHHQKPAILFTHQPLNPIIDNYLIEAIKKTADDFDWWIRLHPRITEIERKALHKILHENGVLDMVEIKKATLLPLPILLQECALHISKFSGSVIEASLIGTPSVILEETGINCFRDIIEQGNAIGLKKPTADSLVEGIREGLNLKIASLGKDISFKTALDEIQG